MSRAVSRENVITYHERTGLGLEDAREALAMMKPELRGRVLLAARSRRHGDGLLRDPVEDHPQTRQLVRKAASDADSTVTDQGLGRCHSVWREQARILWKRHKIRWYSPAEMNPSVCFD